MTYTPEPFSIEKYKAEFTYEALQLLMDFPYPEGHEAIIEERRKIQIALETYFEAEE